MEHTGDLIQWRNFLCAMLLIIISVSDVYLILVLNLCAFGFAGEKETKLVSSVLS